MTRDEARQFVRENAATDTSPQLTADEVDRILDQSMIVDAKGRRKIDPYYRETFWGTRAVVLALDLKLARASNKFDLSADGTVIRRSQVVENLRDLRRSWRSRMVPGSV